MRFPCALALPLLSGCLATTIWPTCDIDKTEVGWDESTSAGIASEWIAELDVSGEYLGEYDQGMGEVGVEVLLERGAGSPKWVVSTESSQKTRHWGFGVSSPTLLRVCVDGLEIPTRTRVATTDGELEVDAPGTAYIMDPDEDPGWTEPGMQDVNGETDFDDATLPRWSLEELDTMDEVWANNRLTVQDGVLVDGFAGWWGNGEDANSKFSRQSYTVTFPLDLPATTP